MAQQACGRLAKSEEAGAIELRSWPAFPTAISPGRHRATANAGSGSEPPDALSRRPRVT